MEVQAASCPRGRVRNLPPNVLCLAHPTPGCKGIFIRKRLWEEVSSASLRLVLDKGRLGPGQPHWIPPSPDPPHHETTIDPHQGTPSPSTPAERGFYLGRAWKEGCACLD